jgi:hypothetical protein
MVAVGFESTERNARIRSRRVATPQIRVTFRSIAPMVNDNYFSLQ